MKMALFGVSLASAVLDASHVPNAPLEVGVGVSLDEGVDGSHLASLVGGGVASVGLFVRQVDRRGWDVATEGAAELSAGGQLQRSVLSPNSDQPSFNCHAQGTQHKAKDRFDVHDCVSFD